MQIGPEEPSSSPVRLEHVVHALTRWIGSTLAIVLVICMAAAWLLTRPLFANRQDWQDAALVPVTLLTFVLI
jgi:low affinity Fe/Cu permease